jgi:protein transport protein SEC20
MQSELSRSRFAQETLEQSTAALADLGEKYTDLNTLLSKSRSLVTTLLKSQKSDTWYLETTLYILLTTVIWLIFRRWLYGPITWFIIWPLKLLFRIAFAIVPTASVANTSSVSTAQEPSTSLIIKPSATDRPPKRINNPNQPPPYIRVGGGGRGYPGNHPDPNYAANRPDPSPPGSLSQTVGKMAEQSQQSGEQKEPVVRGDGTVLPDRPSDRPANPKKKMWEEDVESAKHEREEAEKGEQEGVVDAGGGEGGDEGPRIRKRDEL